MVASARAWNHGLLGGEEVDSDIVAFQRNFVQDPDRGRHPDRDAVVTPDGQQLVVVALAAAEPAARPVECEPGHENQVDLVNRNGIPCRHRLLHPPTVGLTRQVTIAKGQRAVLLHPRQDPAPAGKAGKERFDIDLRRHRQVGGDGARQSGRHPHEHLCSHLGRDCGSHRAERDHPPPEFAFVHGYQAKPVPGGDAGLLIATVAAVKWLLVLPRTIITWVVGVIATIIGAISVMVLALINDTTPWIERVIRAWSRAWLIASGTKLEVEGTEHIDPTRSYVVVANHLSTLDIMACFLAVRLPIRYLAKKELFRVPLLAQGMRAVGIIEVDREARGAIHAAVNRQAKDLIEKKRSLIIYAEGTRPRNGIMKPFKKGAFTMAVASQLPILPLSIHGTYEAFRPGRPWVFGGTARVVIDPVIETAGKTHSDVGALRDQTQSLIASRVQGMGGRTSF